MMFLTYKCSWPVLDHELGSLLATKQKFSSGTESCCPRGGLTGIASQFTTVFQTSHLKKNVREEKTQGCTPHFLKNYVGHLFI